MRSRVCPHSRWVGSCFPVVIHVLPLLHGQTGTLWLASATVVPLLVLGPEGEVHCHLCAKSHILPPGFQFALQHSIVVSCTHGHAGIGARMSHARFAFQSASAIGDSRFQTSPSYQPKQPLSQVSTGVGLQQLGSHFL